MITRAGQVEERGTARRAYVFRSGLPELWEGMESEGAARGLSRSLLAAPEAYALQ